MKQNKRAAVFPSKGIGDALLMMIASNHLLLQGYEITTFHEKLKNLESWFPGHLFQKEPQVNEIADILKLFDLVIVQNDAKDKISLFQRYASHLSIFYVSYNPLKHLPLSSFDQVFDLNDSMVENIARSTARLLNLKDWSTHNGLCPPKHLIHRKYDRRLLIHPTSSLKEKNWPLIKFIGLAKKVKKLGWDPIFILSKTEECFCKKIKDHNLQLQLFESLTDLAAFIFESSLLIANDSLAGHLASNMKIDHIVISDNEKRMKLWRPGWHPGIIVVPHSWIPNLKFLRLREKYWKKWISIQKVASEIDKPLIAQKIS